MLPNCKLSHIQWRMITDIGKNESTDNLINLSDFFKLLEISAKKNMFSNNIKTFNSNNDFKQLYYGKFDTINNLNRDRNKKNIIEGKLNKTLTSTSSNNPKFKNIRI